MKLDYVSDLHLDWYRHKQRYEYPDARWILRQQQSDILLLGGDICDDWTDSVELLLELAKNYRKVIWCDGNHDFYNAGNTVEHMMQEMRARLPNIHYLPFDPLFEDGVAVIGCNGWYDFNFTPDICSEQEAFDAWKTFPGKDRLNLQWETSVADLAQQQATQLEQDICFAVNKNNKIVILTHTPPHPNSLNLSKSNIKTMNLLPGSLGSSHLTKILQKYGEHIDYWIHGHEHGNKTYRQNGVMVLANARGFPWDGAEKSAINTLEIK